MSIQKLTDGLQATDGSVLAAMLDDLDAEEIWGSITVW